MRSASIIPFLLFADLFGRAFDPEPALLAGVLTA